MLVEPQCHIRGCCHLQGVRWLKEGEEASEVPVCPAFPRGIPFDIAYGDNLHLARDARQEGAVVFEP